jgi:hypothetical protein
MSELLMTIGEGLTVLVDYDYQASERGDKETPPVNESVAINAVCVDDIDIFDILSQITIEKIELKIFDSYDKELQEPERE